VGRIVWLASYPKSGNTWMRAFLFNVIGGTDKPADINRMTGTFSRSDSAIGWFRILRRTPPQSWTAREIAAMRPRVQEMIANGQSATIFCKTHSALIRHHGAPTVNRAVSAGAIYILRNPLDVVLSFADFMDVTVDAAIGFMATPGFMTGMGEGHVPVPLDTWSRNVESWTAGHGQGHGQSHARGLHTVRYEDMLADPRRTFRAVTRFLDLDVTAERLDTAIGNASFRQLRKQERQHGFNERSQHQDAFFRKGTAGHWRDHLTEAQIARICNDHRAQMKRFDYLPDGFQDIPRSD